jgi:hypothetical protein
MPINLHINDGQNKLGGRISKNVAKIATIIGSKLAARPLLANLLVITWSFFIRF